MCSEAPYLRLWTWVANQDCFPVSKWLRSSWQQKGVSFLLIKFQTAKFLIHHFREQGFPVNQKAVVTQRRGWLWHFSCSVPLGGILFHGNFVSSLADVCPPSLMNGRAAFFPLVWANFYFFTHFSYLLIANSLSLIAYPPGFDTWFWSKFQAGRGLLKLQLYRPLDIMTWTSIMLSVYETASHPHPRATPTRNLS